MPQQKIILLYSDGKSNEKRLTKYFSDENICWTYFGPNYINFKRIDSYLKDHFRYIEISERLDKISDRIRDQYQHYIDELNTANKDTFEWWFTPTSSRNPYMSGMFQNICYLELIKEILSESSDAVTLVIVAENYPIGHAIEANAHTLGVEVISIGKNKRSFPSKITSGIWWTGKCLFKAGLNYGYARLSAIRTEKKPPQRYSGISGKTCMIDVFVYEKNFADDGGFADRYFPGLEQFLIKNGYNVVYCPKFTETKLNKYNLYCKARANDRVFLIEQDFLKITDYFKSLKYAFKSTTFCVKAPQFRGFDVEKIDNGDFKWDCFENIFKAYLQYYAFLRMSTTLGDKFERIISWHENQLQNKAICKAVHETFNGCKIVGSHGYVHYLNETNFYPLHSESVCGYVPDVLLSPGPIFSRDLEKYVKEVPVIASVPLRYSYLNTENSRNSNIETISYPRDVLIMLPYSRIQCVELLSRLLRSLENSINTVYVRCHPDYDEQEILKLLKNIPHTTKIKFVNNEKLADLFQKGYVVVSVASGTIIESMAYGNLIVIVASNNALSDSPIDKTTRLSCDIIQTCYDDQSLRSAINKMRFMNKSEINHCMEDNIQKYIYQNTETYLLPYIT